MKKPRGNIIIPGLFLTIILFFIFPLSFEMSMGEPWRSTRGYGFPYIFWIDDPATSLYRIIDIRSLLIDFLLYAAFLILILFVISSVSKRQIYLNKRISIILGIIIIVFVLVTIMPSLYFSSFSEIEYVPIYETIKVNFLFFNY